MSDGSFASILHFEVQKMRELIERMGDNHPDLDGNGIMGQIRAERLQLLERLLEFESSREHPTGDG